MLLPVLGFASLVAAIAVLGIGRRDRVTAWPAAGAVAALAASIVITLAVHAPQNFEVLEWSADAPPPNWEGVRDRWANWQGVRVLLATIAFLLLVLPQLRPRRGRP